MSEIRGPSGGDPTKAINAALDEEAKSTLRDAADVWFTAASDRLVEAAEGRAGIDAEGKTYREENNLMDMMDEFQPPQWDDREQAFIWSITHHAAVFHEFGAVPHEIEAKKAQALAFEWPDAPDEVKEQFEDTYPLVFFNRIQHPGIPAIGMVRYGRDEARRWLEGQGVEAAEFGRRREP